MTLLVGLFSSVVRGAAYQFALDGGFALLFLAFSAATKFDRIENKRGYHYDQGQNLKVSHDLTSFNFRIGGEKPSAICFLPAGSPRAPLVFYHNDIGPSTDIFAILGHFPSPARRERAGRLEKRSAYREINPEKA